MTQERQRLRILYEDRLGDVPEFALHRLVLAAAQDDCALEMWRLGKRVIAIPKKGHDRVLQEVSRASRHMDSGVCLLAWIDNDHVRDPLPHGSRMSRAEVIAHIKGLAGEIAPDRLEVFLLEQNLESLLEAVARELESSLGAEVVRKAIEKKRVDNRDICLLHIASTPELRALLRARHAGFDEVIRFVAEIATREPWPFHGR